jgi:hypothetical protein
MNIPRLLRLKAIMEAVSRIDNSPGEENRLFSIDRWMTSAGDIKLNNEGCVSSDYTLETCGAVCCVLGWAAIDPVMAEEGLRMSPFAIENKAVQFTNTDGNFGVGFEAGVLFFEITMKQSQYLFDPDAYLHDANTLDEDGAELHDGDDVAPSHTIARIQRVLDGYEGRPFDDYNSGR